VPSSKDEEFGTEISSSVSFLLVKKSKLRVQGLPYTSETLSGEGPLELPADASATVEMSE
jgi:hypothetical protein